jgi:hypothetical protein
MIGTVIRQSIESAARANPLEKVKVGVGNLLIRLRAPGAIRQTEFRDRVGGDHLAVSIGPLFVRVSVNGRNYFFDRFTGKFDGTGTGSGC